MLQYEWQGIDRRGEPQSGMLYAPSRHAMKQQLRQQGILIRSIRRKINLTNHRHLKPHALSICFHQLAISLTQGIPILHLLESMASYQPKGPLKHALKHIHQSLSHGCSLFEALKQHPNCFPHLACLWVQMGEQFGTLPEVLHHIADYYAAQARFKQRLRKALTYPLTVLFMASLVIISLMIVVVPQFAEFYHYFSADMPWATSCLIQLSHVIQRHGYLTVGLLIALASALARYRKWSQYVEPWLLSFPLLGHLLKLIALARMLHTLRTTYISGLSLLDGFQAAQQVAGYALYTKKMIFLLQLLKQGEPLRVALQHGQIFPTFVMHLLCLGEETGTLQTALQQVTTYYEQEIERRIYTFTTVFEPLLMALLGIGIGALIIALYLPILNLGSIL